MFYLVHLKAGGATTSYFLFDDPRRYGYPGAVEQVSLQYEEPDEYGQPDPGAPKPCYGRNPDDAKDYRQFTTRDAVRTAGWVPLSGPFRPPCYCVDVFGETAWK